MHSKLSRALIVGAVAVCTPTAVQAQQSGGAVQDLGKREYQAHCAVCHGTSGKGDGIYADLLKSGTVVANLTELSKNNNGVFPFKRVSETIEFGVPGAHGTKEMPIWGPRYRLEAGQGIYDDYTESYVRARIIALTEYIYSLQAK